MQFNAWYIFFERQQRNKEDVAASNVNVIDLKGFFQAMLARVQNKDSAD